MNRYIKACLKGSACTLAIGTAAIDVAAQETSLSTEGLEEITVTAGRREQLITDVQASIEVITAEDIAKFSGASITEALRQAIGVDARTSGANSTVSIRGQIPNAGSAVLILVDGLPRTGKFGLVNLNNYPVEDVGRVEVIRGPMSSLYGANASAGVINVITKQAGDGAVFSFRTTGGLSATDHADGRETLNVGASVNAKTGEVGHRVSVDYRTVEPFRFDSSANVDDLLGIDHLSLTYSGRTQTGETGDLRWTFEAFFQNDRGNDVARGGAEFERVEEEDRYYGSIAWDVDAGPGVLSLEGSHGFSDGSANRSFPAPDEFTEFEQSLIQGRYFLPVENHNILVGAGAQRDEIDVSILTKVGEVVNTFAFAQDEWDITDNIRLTAGFRADDFDAFGTHVVPRVSIGSLGNGFTWRAGYGEAFRAPSVLEQFSRFNRGRFLIVGDPTIQPEETETWEAAVGWRGEHGVFEVVYHNSSITNLIQATPNGQVENGLLIFMYQNIAEADISGLEASASYDFGGGLSLNGAYEYLDAVNAQTDERLNGRAKHTVRLNFTYENRRWGATVRGRHIGSLQGIDPNDRARPAFTSNYTTVDMQLRYDIGGDTQVSFGIDNIADEQVPLNWSSTGAIEDPAGRFVYLSLRHAFGGF